MDNTKITRSFSLDYDVMCEVTEHVKQSGLSANAVINTILRLHFGLKSKEELLKEKFTKGSAPQVVLNTVVNKPMEVRTTVLTFEEDEEDEDTPEPTPAKKEVVEELKDVEFRLENTVTEDRMVRGRKVITAFGK